MSNIPSPYSLNRIAGDFLSSVRVSESLDMPTLKKLILAEQYRSLNLQTL